MTQQELAYKYTTEVSGKMDVTFEAWLGLLEIEESIERLPGGAINDFWTAQMIDEKWYDTNYPNPPRTELLRVSTPYIDDKGLMRGHLTYRFSTQEWRSLVNWNKQNVKKD